MEPASSSNQEQNEEKPYMNNEAKKVRVYINELRKRLAQLQNEGDEIERTTEIILGDENNDSHDEAIAALALSSSESASSTTFQPIGATVSESAGFTSLLRKFENMKNGNEPVNVKRGEPEEIRLLRQQNGSIREKIKNIQSRIEKAQLNNGHDQNRNPSVETIVERETCTQLYEAAVNTLKKVNAIEEEIISVESFFKSQHPELPLELKREKNMKSTKY